MKIFEFKTIERKGARPHLIAFPADKIKKIESQIGSENVFLKINGIEVNGSYETLLTEIKQYDNN